MLNILLMIFVLCLAACSEKVEDSPQVNDHIAQYTIPEECLDKESNVDNNNTTAPQDSLDNIAQQDQESTINHNNTTVLEKNLENLTQQDQESNVDHNNTTVLEENLEHLAQQDQKTNIKEDGAATINYQNDEIPTQNSASKTEDGAKDETSYKNIQEDEDKEITIVLNNEPLTAIAKKDESTNVANKIDKVEPKTENKQSDSSQIFKINFHDIILGNPNAKNVIFEYSSFTCPHCADYRKNVYPKIAEKYIQTGKIAYVIREVIGNKQDLDACILVNCVPKEDAHKFLEILYLQQNNWAFNLNYKNNLINIAKIGGLSEESYEKCIADEDLTKRLVETSRAIMTLPDFAGTPTLYLNDKKIDNISPNFVFTAIDAALEKNK